MTPRSSTSRGKTELSRLSEAAERAGLCAAARSPTASDEAMCGSLRSASQSGVSLRFLRLAAPRTFRTEVVNKGAAFDLLANSKSPRIEFILANPYSAPFLNRLDTESKNNCEIRRVRNDVLDFALSLLTAAELRRDAARGELLVAFHSRDLLWNLSITGEERVVLRAYHAASTGHDENIAEVHFRSESDSRLAESFISYYLSVVDDPGTYALTSSADVDSPRLGTLPSLFKGNAVWHEGGDAESGSVCKVLRLEDAREAEANWLETGDREAQHDQFFNPVRLLQRDLAMGKDRHGDFGLRLEAKRGVTATEFLSAIQRIVKDDANLKEKATIVVSGVAGQALEALAQFRDIWNEFGPARLPAAPYPWTDKLVAGLKEAGHFVTRDESLLSQCRDELQVLGRQLELQSDTPFRDAHLKNRLICVDPSLISNGGGRLREWLRDVDRGEISFWLRKHTYDIDFETGCWLVPEWDDLLHVLSSPNLGLCPSEEARVEALTDLLALVAEWCKKPTDPGLPRTTLLCRSFRELCRRIWYSNVMPNTYQRRYRNERRRHLVDLAQGVAQRVKGCEAMNAFLTQCRESIGTILQMTEGDGFQQPVAANHGVYVTLCGRGDKRQETRAARSVPRRPLASKRFDVALSFPGEYRAHVSSVAKELGQTLGAQRVFYDKDYEAELARPDLATYLQRIYHDHSELVAVFLCPEYERKEWCGLEWRAILDLMKRRRQSEIMFLQFDETDLLGLFSIDGYADLRGLEPSETAKLILERLAFNRGEFGSPGRASHE